MDSRLYPVEPEFFRQVISPLIEGSYIWKGRPPKIGHYAVFCAILYSNPIQVIEFFNTSSKDAIIILLIIFIGDLSHVGVRGYY